MLKRAGWAIAVLAIALVFAPTSAGWAQEAEGSSPPLEVGAVAPDFAIPGATRYGVLDQPVRLSDYEGKVVVLAFFFRARTRG